ncbi:transcriptional regulator [Saccharopolyspora sp. NPDC002376]
MASTPTIRLRVDRLSEYRTRAGLHTNYALAKAMGVHQSTVDRVLDGNRSDRRNIGPAVIAGILIAFAETGAQFEDLFTPERAAIPTRDAA